MPASGSAPVVAAVFDIEEDTAQALDALREAGVHPEQVSLMMSQEPSDLAGGPDPGAQIAGGAASGATVGGLVGGLAGGLLGLAALAIPGVGPVLGAGVLGSLLAGAAVGAAAGGLLGGLVGLGIPEDEARTYESHLREGRALLTVHPPDMAAAQHLRAVLEASGAHDVRVYDAGIPVAATGPPADVAPPLALQAEAAAGFAGPVDAEIRAAEPAGAPVSNVVEDSAEPAEPAQATWPGEAAGAVHIAMEPKVEDAVRLSTGDSYHSGGPGSREEAPS